MVPALYALNRSGNTWLDALRSERKDPVKLLKETEVQELMQCSARHIQNLRKRRLLTYLRIGRSIRYDIRDVEAALKKLRVEELG